MQYMGPGEYTTRPFNTIKELLALPPVLTWSSINYSMVVTADVSSHGFGSVCIQTQPEGH